MLKYLYIDHKTKEVSTGTGKDFPDPNEGCIWLFVSSPSAEEKEMISEKFEIDPVFIRDYTRQVRSKRYSTSPLIFMMVDYFTANGSVKKTNMLMVLKKDVFITILPADLSQYNDFFNEIKEYMKEKPKSERNIGEILYEFLDRDVQDNYEVLRRTEEKIADIEEKIIIKGERLPEHVNEILDMKRELFAMSRRFWSTSKIIFLLRKGLLSIDISPKTVGLLDDTYDSFQHQIEVLETQRDMLGDVLTLYEVSMSNRLAIISNDMSMIMKRLTALTVIVLMPSLLAGIYGMNFKNLPGADSPIGFWGVVALMAISALLIYFVFHRKKWI